MRRRDSAAVFDDSAPRTGRRGDGVIPAREAGQVFVELLTLTSERRCELILHPARS